MTRMRLMLASSALCCSKVDMLPCIITIVHSTLANTSITVYLR